MSLGHRFDRAGRRLALVVALVVGTLSARPAAAQTCQWIGGTGDWDNEKQWTCARVPGDEDLAAIDAGVVIVNDARTVGRVILTGGAWISGGGHLTVTEEMEWRSGTLNGRD